jgi:predicted molibdopterin-dependent oxidoreductase YjgC
MIRRDGTLVSVGWDEAISHVAARIDEIKAAKGDDAVAVLGSSRITNEGNFAVASVARAVGTSRASWRPDYDLATFFKSLGGRLATKADIYAADRIFVIGGDPKEYQPLTAYFILQAVLNKGTELYVAGSRLSRIRKRAKQFVHLRPGGEAALLRGLAGGAGDAAAAAGCTGEEIDALREALEGGKRVVVMVGGELEGAALEAAASLGSLLASGDRDVSYRPLVYYNNSMGVYDAFTASGATASYAEVVSAIGGEVAALYAVGDDLLEGGDEGLRERLGRLDLLVVQDLFMTETAMLADVVLPASSYAEQDGTFTNIGGEVQRVHKSIEPVGHSRPDWTIAPAIARALG